MSGIIQNPYTMEMTDKELTIAIQDSLELDFERRADNDSDIKRDRHLCFRMLDVCEHIFDEYGGYEYHDEMGTQLSVLRESISECEDVDYEARVRGEDYHPSGLAADWIAMFEDADSTYKWFTHIGKSRELQISIPPTIYG